MLSLRLNQFTTKFAEFVLSSIVLANSSLDKVSRSPKEFGGFLA
jgi:hypothetical protein